MLAYLAFVASISVGGTTVPLASVNSIPVYLTTKYTFDTGSVKPYLKADLGYSFNTNKANGGLYYGAGVGVSYNNFNVDLMYKENKSRIDEWFWNGSLNYKRVTLGVGYNFGL